MGSLKRNGISGASAVGAIYADHLANRASDPIPVAPNRVQLCDGDHHVRYSTNNHDHGSGLHR